MFFSRFAQSFLILLSIVFVSFLSDGNKFSNPGIAAIAELQDKRNANELISFFQSADPYERFQAASAFSSVQDTLAEKHLLALLSDADEQVRMAVWHALGQLGRTRNEQSLIQTIRDEQSEKVKAIAYEAIGKCGSDPSLRYLASLNPTSHLLKKYLAVGLYRAGIRGFSSPDALKKIFQLLDHDNPLTAREHAAYYLYRVKSTFLLPYRQNLRQIASGDPSTYVKMYAVASLGKLKDTSDIQVLHNSIIDFDYRVRITSVRACENYPYKNARDLVFSALKDNDINIQIAAGEYFVSHGKLHDSHLYITYSDSVKNWRVKALLVQAHLKQEEIKDSTGEALRKYLTLRSTALIDPISNKIMAIYDSIKNNYYKAALLTALGERVGNYTFIAKKIFSGNTSYPESASGMEALAAIRRHPHFSLLVKFSQQKEEEFYRLLRQAVSSGDVVKVSFAAEILLDSLLGYKNRFPQTDYMLESYQKLTKPGDQEARTILEQLMNYYGTEYAGLKSPAYATTNNWQLIGTFPYEKTAVIRTSKGPITVNLFVEKSPLTVMNFLSLAKNNFYDNIYFHRVVPNFVIQAGCPRGDGWGGPDFSIRSEFTPLFFDEGYLGMASSGKDTEGSQWFITHSPQYHLDGRYTIFGKVVKGMSVVHRIEIGDRILDIMEQ